MFNPLGAAISAILVVAAILLFVLYKRPITDESQTIVGRVVAKRPRPISGPVDRSPLAFGSEPSMCYTLMVEYKVERFGQTYTVTHEVLVSRRVYNTTRVGDRFDTQADMFEELQCSS